MPTSFFCATLTLIMSKEKNILRSGDKIRIITPSESFSNISSIYNEAKKRLEKEFGVEVELGEHCSEIDLFGSSSIESRIYDLHEAFLDKKVKAIICATGGYSSNDLLPFIDWEIIKNNPKPFIGSSDITVLLNAIYAKTGIKTYFGPNFYKFGMNLGLEYTIDYFKKCLFSNNHYEVLPSEKWSEDRWYKDQNNREFKKNNGHIICNQGSSKGKIIGGNLCSLNLLQGTPYMPNLKNSILFIEDDNLAGEKTPNEFARNLESLLQQPDANFIKGVILGRFFSQSQMSIEKINFLINSKRGLKNIPVIADVDFGHTDPSITFPIGEEVELAVQGNSTSIKIG